MGQNAGRGRGYGETGYREEVPSFYPPVHISQPTVVTESFTRPFLSVGWERQNLNFLDLDYLSKPVKSPSFKCELNKL